MITKINEAKTLEKGIYLIVNGNLIVKHINHIANEIMCEKYLTCKNDYSTCICENSRYLKSIDNDSVIVCDEIINVRDNASTNVTNAIPTNVKRFFSINSDDKKETCEKSLIHTISLVIIYLL